jgi:chitinase
MSMSRRDSLADIMYTNAVYYLNNRVYCGETPESLNFRCISHVFYAFAGVGPDGFVYVSPPLLASCLFMG